MRGESVGAGFVPVPSDIEISCPQVWSTLVQGGIGERHSVPGGIFCGTTLSTVKVWPAVRNYLMSNPAPPLLPSSWSGIYPYSIFYHILSARIYPFAPVPMSSCVGIFSASRRDGGGPPSQTPSEYQKPADCMGSGIGLCWCWGNLTLWGPIPRSVSVPPSWVSAPGWKEEGMLQWAGYICLWQRPCTSPRSASGSVLNASWIYLTQLWMNKMLTRGKWNTIFCIDGIYNSIWKICNIFH